VDDVAAPTPHAARAEGARRPSLGRADPTMTLAAQDWTAQRERSNMLALRVMAWIAVHLGRRVARWVLVPISIYFVLFSPKARRQSRRYLKRVLGRDANWIDGYRHVHTFASTVLDRVWFVLGRLEDFDVRVSGADHVLDCLSEGRGAFLLGAHIGSFEVQHAMGNQLPGLRVAMVMYPDNARMIHAVLQAIAPKFELGIIALGRSGATLEIRDWLDGGGLAGMLGDRSLPNESLRAGSGTVMLPFLGVPAPFTDGPFRLAMLLKRRMIFMVGLYHGGNRYEVRFEELADFRTPIADAAARERALRDAMIRYAAKLEGLCREAPYNWFNFHDFWYEDAVA
jgi:predicted LPLAT superfamily acyltransferase